jgi:hypothetical protein
MAVKITREISFGPGTKGFRFENLKDSNADQEQYEEGRRLEEVSQQDGSVGQMIYDRLSSRRAA